MTILSKPTTPVKKRTRRVSVPLVMRIERTEFAGIVEVSSETNPDVWYQVDVCVGVCSCPSRSYPCKHLRAATHPPLEAKIDVPVCKVCHTAPVTRHDECDSCYFGALSASVG